MKENFTFEVFGLIWVAYTFDFCFEHSIFFQNLFHQVNYF